MTQFVDSLTTAIYSAEKLEALPILWRQVYFQKGHNKCEGAAFTPFHSSLFGNRSRAAGCQPATQPTASRRYGLSGGRDFTKILAEPKV